MTSVGAPRIVIVGGGPAGSLLAILLARRKLAPLVVERSPSFTDAHATSGRSINLALAARGITALRRAEIDGPVLELAIPMKGRMLHDVRGRRQFLPYGQRAGEEIYSVSRAALNALLHRIASERHAVEYRFGHACAGIDIDTGNPIVDSPRGREILEADVVFAADGAGSDVRGSLAAAGAVKSSEALLDHGYKELEIAAGAAGEFALDANALHIWPRGGFMLIALPNLDRSFTATLFLPNAGAASFASVGPDHVRDFFGREFPDAGPLIPALETEYAEHPTGLLGSVHCRPWRFRDRVLLVGDAAHAIVPFHGQGMNAAFEDCIELDRLIDCHGPDWPRVLGRFESSRLPNARAIAEMAIENYAEMRDDVRDQRFRLHGELAFELERRFPGRFIPRYSMVMFHAEISYAEAQRRGAIQSRILHRLTRGGRALDDVDFALAAKLVETEL